MNKLSKTFYIFNMKFLTNNIWQIIECFLTWNRKIDPSDISKKKNLSIIVFLKVIINLRFSTNKINN